jgi:glycosyltransferase involved in cell wall biosynthesis
LKAPYTTNHDRVIFSQLCKKVFDRVDRIVAISETSRIDAIELLGVPQDKIVVIYQSVSPPAEIMNRPEPCLQRDIEKQFNLEPNNYFLYFGAIEPKKNLLRTLEAALTSETNLTLVVVGRRGWSNDAESHFLSSLENQRTPRIRQLDYLTETQLASLVRCARATVFPSIYEGFGLPALESLTLGTPVLASNTPALMEVCGKAACYADPFDIASIREAFTRLSRDLTYCADLRAAGIIQAQKFSPEKYKRNLEKLYESLC